MCRAKKHTTPTKTLTEAAMEDDGNGVVFGSSVVLLELGFEVVLRKSSFLGGSVGFCVSRGCTVVMFFTVSAAAGLSGVCTEVVVFTVVLECSLCVSSGLVSWSAAAALPGVCTEVALAIVTLFATVSW